MFEKGSTIMEPPQSRFRSGIKEAPVLQGSLRASSDYSDTEKQLSPSVKNGSRPTEEHLTLYNDQDVSFDMSPKNSQTSSSFSSQSPEDAREMVRNDALQPDKDPCRSPLRQPEDLPHEHDSKVTELFPLETVLASEITTQPRRNLQSQLENHEIVSGFLSQDHPRRSSERQPLIVDSLYPLKNDNINSISRSYEQFLKSHEQEAPPEGIDAGYGNGNTKVIRTDATPRSILRQPGSSRSHKKLHRISFASIENKVVENRDDCEEESDYDISEPSIGHSALKAIQFYDRSSISLTTSYPMVNHHDSPLQRLQDTFRSQPHEYQSMEKRNVSNNRNDNEDGVVDAQPRIVIFAATPHETLAGGLSRAQPHSSWSTGDIPRSEVAMTNTQRKTIIPEEDSCSEESSTFEPSHMQDQQDGVLSQPHLPHAQASLESQHISNSLRSSFQLETSHEHGKNINSPPEESFFSESSSTSSNSPVLVSIPNSHQNAFFENRGDSQKEALLNHPKHIQHPQRDTSKDANTVRPESDSRERDSMTNMNRSHTTNTRIAKVIGELTELGRVESNISPKYQEPALLKVPQSHKSDSLSTSQSKCENSDEASTVYENGKSTSTSEVPRIISSTHRSHSPLKNFDNLGSKAKHEINRFPEGLAPEQSVLTHPCSQEHSHHSTQWHLADDPLRSNSTISGKLSSGPSKSRPTVAHHNLSEVKKTTSPSTRHIQNKDCHDMLANLEKGKMQPTDKVSRNLLPEHNSLSPEPVSKIDFSYEAQHGEAVAVKPLSAVNSNLQRKNTIKKNDSATPRKDSNGGDPETSLYHDAAAQSSPNSEPHDAPSKSKRVIRKNLILVTRRKRKNNDASDSNSIVKMSIIPMRQVEPGGESDRTDALKKLFNSFMTRSTSKSSSDHSHYRLTSKTTHKRKKRSSQNDIKDVSQEEKRSRQQLLATSLAPSSNHSSGSSARTSGSGPQEHKETNFVLDATTKEQNSLHSSAQGQSLEQRKSGSIRISQRHHTRRKTNSSSATGPSPILIERDVIPAQNEIFIDDDPISIIHEESISTQHERQASILQSDSDITEMTQKHRKRGMAVELPKSRSSGASYDGQGSDGMGSNTLRNPYVSIQKECKISKQPHAQVEKTSKSSEHANTSYTLQVSKDDNGKIHNINTGGHAGMPIWVAKPSIHLVHLPTGEVSATDEPIPLLIPKLHMDCDGTEKDILSITRGYLGDEASQSFSQIVLSNSASLSSKQEDKKMYNKEVLTESPAVISPVQSMEKESYQTHKKPQTHTHSPSDVDEFCPYQSDGDKTQGTQHHNSNRCRSDRSEIDDIKGGRQKDKRNINHSTTSFPFKGSPCDRAREKECDKSHTNVDNQFGSDSNLSKDSGISQEQAASGSPLIEQSADHEVETPSGLVHTFSKSNSDRHHKHHHHQHQHHSHHPRREDEISKGKRVKKGKSQSADQHYPLDHNGDLEKIEDLFKDDPATSLEYQLGVIMGKKHKKGKRRLKREQKRQRGMEEEIKGATSEAEVEVGTRVFDVSPSTWYQTENGIQKPASYVRPRFAAPEVITEGDHMNRNNQAYVRHRRTQSVLSQASKMLNNAHQSWPDTARHSLGDPRRDPVASLTKRSTSWDDYKQAASCAEKFRDDYSRPLENNSDFSGARQDFSFHHDTLRPPEGAYARSKHKKDVRDDLKDSFSASHSYFNRSTSRDRNQLVSPFVQVGKTSFVSSYHSDVTKNNSSFVHELVDTPPRRDPVSVITPRDMHHGVNKNTSERDWRVERYLPSPIINETSDYETNGRLSITEYVVKDRRAARDFVYAMRRVVDGLNMYKALV